MAAVTVGSGRRWRRRPPTAAAAGWRPVTRGGGAEHVLKATVTDTTKTLIYSGRPLRTFITPYVKEFETRPAGDRVL